MTEREQLSLRLTQVNRHKLKRNVTKIWSFEDKCL